MYQDMKKLSFSGPGRYQIEVQGHLDESWSDRLSGMQIIHSSCDCDPPLTTLIGPVRDQAELIGVLNSLYELHMPVMKVRFLGGEVKDSS